MNFKMSSDEEVQEPSFFHFMKTIMTSVFSEDSSSCEREFREHPVVINNVYRLRRDELITIGTIVDAHVDRVKDKILQDKDFLECLLTSWVAFRKSVGYLLICVAGVHILPPCSLWPNSTERNLYTILKRVCYKSFSDRLILDNSIVDALRKELLSLVAIDRIRGDIENIFMLFHALRILEELQPHLPDSLSLYKIIFEDEFLRTSADYFKMERLKLLEENTPEDYLVKIENFIKKETSRVRVIKGVGFPEDTLSKILQLLCLDPREITRYKADKLTYIPFGAKLFDE